MADGAPIPSESDRAAREAATTTFIGRYRIVRLLGEGAMGRVHLAHDPELQRDVAVKVLRDGDTKELFLARFKNEMRAAAKFQHANVVMVHDAGEDPVAGPFVVYEFIAGRSLRALLDAGPVAPKEIVRIGRGVASALDALHAAGVVHRDIKPDNILLAADGAVKLADLGIARVPDAALTRDGQFVGTPAYAPPEAITRGDYSSRGDVYSLASMLYESLTGVRPFPGDDAVRVSYAVVHDTYTPPSALRPSLSKRVDEVFAAGLSRRAVSRPASAGSFVAMLATALREPTGPTAAPSLPIPRWSVVAGAALALLTFTVGAYRLTRPPAAETVAVAPTTASTGTNVAAATKLRPRVSHRVAPR